MSVKLYRRPILVSQYDITGMETWLEKNAEKGLLLYDLGCFYGKFTKSEPKKVRYRLEPVGSDPEYPTLLMKDLYEENGWRYIATFRKLFHVFMTEDVTAQEIHTDPVVQNETMKTMSRRRRNSIVYSFVYEVVFIGLTIYGLTLRDQWVSHFILGRDSALFVLIPIYILMGIVIIVSTRPMAKLRRSLRAGRPIEHRSSYKRAVMFNGFTALLILVSSFLLVSTLILINTTGFSSMRSLSDARSDMPVLRLEALDPDYADYSDGHFYREYSPLVPKQYVVMQGLNTEDTHMQTVLQTEYYKTAFSCLVDTVYDEMIHSSFERINVTTAEFEMSDYETLNTPLFDEAAYARIKNPSSSPNPDNYAQYIIAYRDKTVVVVRYEGEEYLPDKLGAIADAFLWKTCVADAEREGL